MLSLQENVSLQPYNTFGVEAQARFFAVVTNQSDLLEALEWQQSQADCPLLILGGGSNLLFTRDWPGLVLQINLRGHDLMREDKKTVEIRFAAGENWHEAVLYTVDQGWGGLENLSLIPGQVGTTPVQNIGAYGVEVKDTIVAVDAVNITDRTFRTFTNQDCQFGYRDSVFKGREKGSWIITAVTFKLQKNPVLKLDYGVIKETLKVQNVENPTVQDVSQAVIAIRQSKLPDPVEIGNGGSFFKNPIIDGATMVEIQNHHPDTPHYEVDNGYKIPAAWLIETAGWKGHRVGQAGVHDRQALVLVNHGGATGAEIWELAQTIQQDVATKFNIRLKPEINII